ncbi:cytochrome P450 [Ephemerocybe angulata]|uniref:Cytochrome P450 n=1 Tax=Ephemerocybe angulata TaxID=980116 RepID=A0A8H6LWR9_9AGAR|nr:cytochrome P450 [Tulosesus angulatus]
MPSPAAYVGLAVAGWLSYQWYWFRQNLKKVSAIPTIGSDGFIGSYLSAWKYFVSGHKMIEEGYRKYPGGAFKVATFETPSRWLIIVVGPKLSDDIRKASDDYLASNEPTIDTLQMDYTFGTERPHTAAHHMQMFSRPMTRNIAARFPDVQDEVVNSFKELLPASEDWTSYTVMETILPIVTRTSNRFFVGLPLCRNREYCSTLEQFAVRLMVSAYAITLSPSFFRPIVAALTTNVHATQKKLRSFLGPVIQDRLRMYEDSGVGNEEKPNDMITWLLDLAPEDLRTTEDVVARLLISNFAAIHTTTMSLSDVLFHLAAYQEYIEPLRSEVDSVISTYGWSKESMVRLHKLDSYMKEVGRMRGVNNVTSQRKALKDFTFSNGVVVPKGFTVGIASSAQHYDSTIYEEPELFDPNRFLPERLQEKHDGRNPASAENDNDPSSQVKHQMVSLDTNYILFGVGRHACPGRFFAVNELKGMAAYILLNYDLKLPNDEKVPPPGQHFGSARSPNPSAKILFRKRRT